MMGLKREHWPPCNDIALIALKNTKLSQAGKVQLFYTEPVNWDHCCKPCHQLRKGNPNPNKGRKETLGKMGGLWPLQSFTAQQGSYGVMELFVIDTGGCEKGEGKRLLTKIKAKITGSWLPVGASIIFRHRSSLALSVQQHKHEHCPAALESCGVAPDWFRAFCSHVLSTDISWQTMTAQTNWKVNYAWVLQTLKQHGRES